MKGLRSWRTFWMARQTLAHLEAIRNYELEVIVNMLPKGGRLLEIGAGTGWQAKALEARGFEVSAIDVTVSNYKQDRVWPVIDYDGKIIPFSDHSFDIVFSSNTLEHIPHVKEFQSEIKRVLKPEGVALHVVPSATWRFWTNFTEILRYGVWPKAHGEHSPNVIAEVANFRKGWWSKLFRAAGWKIVRKTSNRIFYTGCSVMDARFSIGFRKGLSYLLGGSCNVFILRKP